jgi:hypothetical protein
MELWCDIFCFRCGTSLVSVRVAVQNIFRHAGESLSFPKNPSELQISEAFPWNEAPRYLIRDRDRVYGTMVTRRVRAMGSSKPDQQG